MKTNTAAISGNATPAGQSETALSITTFSALNRPRGQRRTLSWSSLRTMLSRPRIVAAKSLATGWCPATFTDDHRGAERVEQVQLLGFDLDEGIERDELQRRLTGTRAIVHSTWSHTIGKDGAPAVPRWRVLIALSRPLRACEYAGAWPAVRDRFCLRADDGAKDASRFWYLPSSPPERALQFESFVVDGEPIDVDGIDNSYAASPRRPRPREAAPRLQPSSLDTVAGPLGAQLALLDRRGQLVGHRSTLAMVLGQALFDEGLDAPAVLRRTAEVAGSLGADVDLDDDGRGLEGWARRAVNAPADKPARRFGSLAHDHPRIGQVLRRAVDREYLSSGAAPSMVAPDQAEAAITAALERGDDLIAVTAGAGKSRAARAFIARRLREKNESAAVFVPTHALAEQYEARLVADHGVTPARRRRSLLSIPGCERPDSLRAALALGRRASEACRRCPVRDGCTALEALGREPKARERTAPADVSVGINTKLAEELHAIRLDSECGYIAPGLVVIDEPPAATVTGKASDLALVGDVVDLLSPVGVALAQVLERLMDGVRVTAHRDRTKRRIAITRFGASRSLQNGPSRSPVSASRSPVSASRSHKPAHRDH